MRVIKETDNVIIYRSDRGIVSYRFKVKDNADIIEAIR